MLIIDDNVTEDFNANNGHHRALKESSAKADEEDGLVIYRFKLADHVYRIKLITPPVPLTYSSNDDYFSSTAGLPNRRKIISKIGSSRDQAYKKADSKILIQYFSSKSNSTDGRPIREEEVTLTDRAKCIYEGYVNQRTHDIILFDAPVLAAPATSLTTPPYDVTNDNNNKLGDSTSTTSEFNFATTAVFNLCGKGLMGMFQIGDKQYFIEPLQVKSIRYTASNNYTYDIPYKGDDDKGNGTAKQVSQPHIVYSLSPQKLPFDKYNFTQDSTMFSKPSLPSSPPYFPTAKNDDDGSLNRKVKKRSISREHFIETMVVADFDVAKSHGPDLHRYIMTIISIVEMIYKNPSIGNAINIVLVKIAIFQDSNYAPKITGNGELTLGNFCEWQNRHNTKSLYEPFHHDTAILLTRQDICSNEINCQTLAMTRGSICDPSTSCAIAEDNGLSVALTIAHEIGHNLGVPHDGDPYCKEFEMKEQEDDLKTFHIMSKVLFQNNRILSWSKCSQHYISLFLDKGLGHCLLNKPERMEYMSQMKVLRLPGEEYSLHQQCQLIFGPQSYFCPHVNKFPCQYLYCLNEDRKCMYGDAHWADGTSCGTNKWCQSGSCAERVAHSIISLDGGWSDWSKYTTCSRSCGGGIRISTRACTNPTPANNGKYCLGERSRAESCNTHNCEEGDGDFRDVQCARYNNNNRGIIGIDPNVKWIGTYTIPYQDRCKLYCKEEHRTGIYKLADKVIDGTPCDLESTEICIQGICKRVGCDHVINSLAKLDKCGICGGDNSTCLTQAGFYNQIKFGYNNVARIPAGATNLDVRQYGIHGLEADDNYLALMDSNGEYLINGGNSITMTRLDIKHEGTLLQYTGSNKAVERINSTAIIKRDLILQVLTVGELYPPDVRYTYDISSRYKLKKQIYTWNPQGPWSKCGCDGLKSRTILCVNTISYGVESDQKCQHLPTPRPYEESCLRQCKFKWKISNVTPCSVDCGYGFKKNTVVCVKVDEKSSTNRDRDTIVPDSECKTVPLKPPFVEPCSVKPCSTNTYYWEYSQWSECSALCDGGVRTRQASCKDIFNNNRTLHPQTCNNSLTVLSEMCNSTPCRPKWIISNWTLCNVPCGNGYKSRTIQCQFKNQLVALSKCADILGTKPPIEQEPCEGKKLCRWHADPWNKCHNPSGNAVEKCGGEVVGVQERAVKCLLYDSDANIISPASTMIDERHCISFYANKIKPKLSRRCKISCDEQNDRKMKAQLPYQKNVDDISNNIIHQDTNVAALVPIIPTFSQYQTSLDSKQRSPSLLTNNNNNHQQNHMRLEDGTNNNIIYPNLSPTSKDLLATAWKTGTWSQCTKSCGYGIKIRSVYCSYVNGTFIPDQRTCESLKNKPIHSQSCIQRYCEWNFGEWDQCDPPCAGSYKTRKIFCTPIAQNGHHSVIATLESDCDYRLKPINRTKCSHLLPPCTSSDHSAISSSTIRPITKDEIVLVYPTANDYGGRNLRSDDTAPSQIASAAVAPLNSVGKTFPLSLIKKNDNVFNDILKRQFVWRIGPWSPCSSACGHGWRRRSVLCQNTDGTISTHCSLHDKPPAMEQCLGQMCFAWINVSLSQCIQNDCNIYGYQRQRVYCQRGRDFAIVPDELCPQNIRPKDYGNCISPHCIRVNRNSTTNRLFPPNNPQRPSSTQYDTRRLHSRHKGIHEPV